MDVGFPARAGATSARSSPLVPALDIRSTLQNDLDTDKSAERIANYLTAYTARPTLRSQSSRHQPILRRRAYNPFVPVGALRPVKAEHSPEDRQIAKVAAKDSVTVEQFISVCKSDRLELERDLSTYEWASQQRLGTAGRLQEVERVAANLPSIADSLLTIESHAGALCTSIQRGMEKLSAGVQQANCTVVTRPLRLYVRPVAVSHRLQTYYRGAQSISGVPALVHIRGNQSLTDVRISVLAVDGKLYKLRQLQSAVSELDGNRYVKRAIIPKLFFQSAKDSSLQLCFDIDFGLQFVTVVAKLAGEREPVCVLIREVERDLALSCSLVDAPLSVSAAVVGNRALCTVSVKDLKHEIEGKLRIADGKFLWSAEGARGLSFSQKEKQSKLLDADYLSEMIRDFVHILICREEVTVDGLVYTVELFAHKSTEKLKITYQSSHKEVPPDSPHLPLLRLLQFPLLQTCPQTFLRSLELAFVIRALFGTRKNSHMSD